MHHGHSAMPNPMRKRFTNPQWVQTNNSFASDFDSVLEIANSPKQQGDVITCQLVKNI